MKKIYLKRKKINNQIGKKKVCKSKEKTKKHNK